MTKEFIVSQEYLDKMILKVDELKTVRRPEIAKKLQDARAFGDLSENAEYDEAKNEQAEVEAEILKLEEDIRNAKVIVESENKDFVSLGSTVRYFDKDEKKEHTYKITGTAESDPLNGQISNVSPVGYVLIDSKVGDILDVRCPYDYKYKIEVLEIL